MTIVENKIDIVPVCGVMGGIVNHLDFANVDDEQLAVLRKSIAEFGVIMFRQQNLLPQELLALAQRFGPPEIHPVVNGMPKHPQVVVVHKPEGWPATFGHGWHSDNSFFSQPTSNTLLYSVIVPPVGGDTLFQNTRLAYEGLSQGMKKMLNPLRAIHTGKDAFDPHGEAGNKYTGEAPMNFTYDAMVELETSHPLVRAHPLTNSRSLFINPLYTTRIDGMTAKESAGLLDYLYQHIQQPEFGCRISWQKNDLAIWDNRVVQHYALNDYVGHERLMHRVTVKGEVPV